LESNDNEPTSQREVYPPTPHPRKMKMAQKSPRRKRIRRPKSAVPAGALSASDRTLENRPLAATPSSSSLGPGEQTPARPQTSPRKRRGKSAKKRAAVAESSAVVVAPVRIKIEKCGDFPWISVLAEKVDHLPKKGGKKKQEALTGIALRKSQAIEETLAKFDSKGLIDSTNFSVTEPTFTSEDLSSEASTAPDLTPDQREEHMEKCFETDRVLQKAYDSLAAKLRALEGKPDYRTREKLERFGVKQNSLHVRLRGDQAVAFAQWAWADGRISEAWSWLEKAQACYNTYTTSEFYINVKDSKPYMAKDNDCDRVRFVTLTNLYLRLFLDCVSFRLQHTVKLVHSSLLRQGATAADTVIKAFKVANDFQKDSAPIHAITQDRLSLLDDSYGALLMRAQDLKGWSIKALKADSRAASIAWNAAKAAATRLAWSQKDTSKLTAARAAVIAFKAKRFAFILKLSNNALVSAAKCHFAALRATQASDFMVSTIVIDHVTAALAHRVEKRYQAAVNELVIVQGMEQSPRAVVAIMSRTLRGEAGEDAYMKLRPWWHTKSVLRAMEHLMRYPDDCEMAEDVFREDISDLRLSLEKSLAAEAVAAKQALYASNASVHIINKASAAEDVALVEFLGQSLREARVLSSEGHFNLSLNMVKAVDSGMRSRFLELQSLYRSQIFGTQEHDSPCSENATSWLQDQSLMQEFQQLEEWLTQVLSALKVAAQIAMDANTFADSVENIGENILNSIATVACSKLQSWGRQIIAQREFAEIMQFKRMTETVKVLFRKGMKIDGRYLLVSACSRGQLLRVRAVDSATNQLHVVPAGEKEFILFSLLTDQTAEADEISEPIIKGLLEQWFENQKESTLVLSKFLEVGNLAMFVTATQLGKTTTITALESKNGKMHTIQLEPSDMDTNDVIDEEFIVGCIQNKLNPMYYKTNPEIQRVLHPAPIPYEFKEVPTDMDLPVMVPTSPR